MNMFATCSMKKLTVSNKSCNNPWAAYVLSRQQIHKCQGIYYKVNIQLWLIHPWIYFQVLHLTKANSTQTFINFSNMQFAGTDISSAMPLQHTDSIQTNLCITLATKFFNNGQRNNIFKSMEQTMNNCG